MVPAQSKLGHVQLAQQNGAGLGQLPNHRGILIRHPIDQHLRTTGGRNAFGKTEILDGYGNAMKWAAIMAGGNFRFSGGGLGQCLVG